MFGKLLLALGQVLARCRNDARRHSQARGDLNRQAPPGRAVNERVGWREVLGVETECRADDTVRCRGVRLERVVVRRRNQMRAAAAEVVDDGSAEGATFHRVGARAHFVEQDQRRQRQRAVHRHDSGDVR